MRGDRAGGQALGTMGNQKAHHLQPDILRQRTKRDNRRVTSDCQPGLDDMLKFTLHLGRAVVVQIGWSRAPSVISADKRIPPQLTVRVSAPLNNPDRNSDAKLFLLLRRNSCPAYFQ